MQTEQNFLHEISGPLCVSYGYVCILLDEASEKKLTLPPEVAEKLTLTRDALEKLNEAVRLRRLSVADPT